MGVQRHRLNQVWLELVLAAQDLLAHYPNSEEYPPLTHERYASHPS